MPCTLLYQSCIDLDRLRDDWFGRGDAEGRLEKAYQSPDRNHYENRDDAVHHSLESFRFLFADIPQIADEAPEEDDYRQGYEEIDERIEELRHER